MPALLCTSSFGLCHTVLLICVFSRRPTSHLPLPSTPCPDGKGWHHCWTMSVRPTRPPALPDWHRRLWPNSVGSPPTRQSPLYITLPTSLNQELYFAVYMLKAVQALILMNWFRSWVTLSHLTNALFAFLLQPKVCTVWLHKDVQCHQNQNQIIESYYHGI